jgi:hypothetical protein
MARRWREEIWGERREFGAFANTLILSLSKDEPFCSWFDELATSAAYGRRDSNEPPGAG